MNPHVALIEAQRLDLQKQLDAEKSSAQRNKMGQFATPPALAASIVEYAAELIPHDRDIRFLDPAFGTGSFYGALLRSFPEGRVQSADGYELDSHYGEPTRLLWSETPLRLHLADFTQATPPPEEEKVNLLICNPPYVRHHHLSAEQKDRLYGQVRKLTGISLNKLGGLYGYFLLLSHAWMAPGGVAGWLIPSEFMDVNYGRCIKQYLLRQVTLLRIHRFEPTDVQFTDALVSSAVVLIRNEPPPPDYTVEFTFGGSLTSPHRTRQIASAILEQTEKWTSLTNGTVHADQLVRALEPRTEPNLSELFEIRRGLATGSNDFFILNSQQIEQHHLPQEFLLPILPSPRYLGQDVIESKPDGTPCLAEPLFLLSCRLPEEHLQAEYPTLWAYLRHGMAQKIHLSYLCSHRKPWYSQEIRPPAPILCTYMGRTGNERESPFRFILNFSNATAANAYHLLYPKPAVNAVLGSHNDRLMAVWDALCDITPDVLVGEGRVYGGGLHKMEPKELGNIPAGGIVRVLQEYGAVISVNGITTYVEQPHLIDANRS